MSDNRSLFFDEWQACLRAHYIHVVRTNDTVTEPTLRHVLHQTGLTDEELAHLRAIALASPPPGADGAALDGEPVGEAGADVPAVRDERPATAVLPDDAPDGDPSVGADAGDGSPEANGQLSLF